MTHRRRPMIGLFLVGLMVAACGSTVTPAPASGPAGSGPAGGDGSTDARRHRDRVHVRRARHTRPDVRRDRRRPGSVHQHVRAAVRPRCPGQPRAPARDRIAEGLRGRADGQHRHQDRGQVQRRDPMDVASVVSSLERHRTAEGSRRKSELANVAKVEASGQRHRAHDEQAQFVARRHAERSRRHDHVADPGHQAGQGLRDQPGVRRPVQVRRPRRGRSHHPGAIDGLLRRRTRLPRQDRLQADRRRDRPECEPPIGRPAGRRPGRHDRRGSAAVGSQVRVPQGDLERLYLTHGQRRECERHRGRARDHQEPVGRPEAA